MVTRPTDGTAGPKLDVVVAGVREVDAIPDAPSPPELGARESEILADLIEKATDETLEGDFVGALRRFQLALSYDPRDPTVLYGIAFNQRQIGDLAVARLTLRSALRIHRDAPVLLTELGLLLAASGDDAAAVDVLVRSLDLEESEETVIALSTSLRADGRADEAEALVDVRISATPDDADVRLMIERAWAYGAQGRHRDALAELDSVLAIDPLNPIVMRWKATELRILDRNTEAEEVIRNALETHGDDADLLVELGWVLDLKRDRTGALAAFDAALVVDPGDPDANRWRAAELRFLGWFDQAEIVVRENLERAPDDPGLHVELSWVHSARGDHEQALAELERALEIDPFNPEAVRWKVTELVEAGRADEAEATARDAIRRDPDEPAYLLVLGQFQSGARRVTESRASFEAAHRLAPRDVEVINALSAAKLELDEPFDAEALADEELALDHPSVQVIDALGWALIDRGDLSAARDLFRRTIARCGNDDMLFEPGRGSIDLREGHPDLAEVRFRRVVDRGDRSAFALTNLAWAIAQGDPGDIGDEARDQDRRARLNEARDHCRSALADQPANLATHACLGLIAFKLDDERASEKHYLRTIEIDERRGSWVDLGALYNKQLRFDEAEKQLQRAVQIDPHDERAHSELGDLHVVRGDLTQGALSYRRALSADPGNARATKALAAALANDSKLVEAERLLATAADTAASNEEQGQMHLLLGRILLRRGADTQQTSYYRQALDEARRAIVLCPRDPFAQWLAAHASWRIVSESKDPSPFLRRNALRHARRCLEMDSANYEAKLLVDRLEDKLDRVKNHAMGQIAIFTIGVVLLITLWAFFAAGELDQQAVLILTPILAGLTVVGALLPFLVGLKLGGLEAQFRQISETMLEGPGGNPNDLTPPITTLEASRPRTVKRAEKRPAENFNSGDR